MDLNDLNILLAFFSEAYIIMIAQASKKPQLSHGSVCKGSVFKHSFNLLNSNRVIQVLVSASFDHNRGSSISH